MLFYKIDAVYYFTMGLKKGRRVRKIEVPTCSVPEFELGDTATDNQQRRLEREAREREEAQQQQQREEETRREEARAEKTHSQEEGVTEKGQGLRKMTLKQRLLEERQDHQSHDTRRGKLPTSISLPTVATCLSRCAGSGLTRKGHITESRPKQSLDRP